MELNLPGFVPAGGIPAGGFLLAENVGLDEAFEPELPFEPDPLEPELPFEPPPPLRLGVLSIFYGFNDCD